MGAHEGFFPLPIALFLFSALNIAGERTAVPGETPLLFFLSP
jgi:hypothetical protein